MSPATDESHRMKCMICKHGESQPGRSTMTFERSSATLLFKDVPAEVCATCGETYHSDDVTRDLLRQAEQAVSAGAQVLVRKYTA